MALIPSVLIGQLAGAFAAPVRDASTAARRHAIAYECYARSAMAGAFPWAATGAERERLVQSLLGAMIPAGTAPQMAAAWAQGLFAFWSVPPVIFGAGAVTAFPGQPGLQAALTGIFGNPGNTAASAAAAVGQALDAATRTILVTLPIVGPVPLL